MERKRELVEFVEGFQKDYHGTSSTLIQWNRLPGDGSNRTLYRVKWDGNSFILVMNENPQENENGVNENDSFAYICHHLKKKGIAVPEIFRYQRGKGWFILEDLGGVHLYDQAVSLKGDPDRLMALYKEVLDILPIIQIEAAQGFDPQRALNPPYDLQFILRRESGYFCRSYLKRYLQLDFNEEALFEDLKALAERASLIGKRFFLYYDFQSKNIMVKDKTLRFIDFQGGRLGPLHYDLGSLILDPYVNIDKDMQQELIVYYLDRAGKLTDVDKALFLSEYPVIAIHRIMQMLGAFGFLSTVEKKQSFETYIPTAVNNLKQMMQLDTFSHYRRLKELVGNL
ncbi:MAG: phosphotransferase [Thermodesulfobacteriota bacterium]|nr:phosphotransferase [Thermodesulfobacteriota bacterium]